MYTRIGRASTEPAEHTQVDQQKRGLLSNWRQIQDNGNNAQGAAHTAITRVGSKPLTKIFEPVQRSYSRGAHGAACARGCMPNELMPGEILHYIPNESSKIPGYEELDSHYVLILEDSYKDVGYRSNSKWFACLVISTHPPPELQRRPLRRRTEPCVDQDNSARLGTQVFDRNHAQQCLDRPYCKHLLLRSQYDPKQWRHWDWFQDTQISIEAPKMVHKGCLHIMRPLSPNLGVSMTDEALTTVHRLIEAHLSREEADKLESISLTSDVSAGNPFPSWAEMVANVSEVGFQ